MHFYRQCLTMTTLMLPLVKRVVLRKVASKIVIMLVTGDRGMLKDIEQEGD